MRGEAETPISAHLHFLSHVIYVFFLIESKPRDGLGQQTCKGYPQQYLCTFLLLALLLRAHMVKVLRVRRVVELRAAVDAVPTVRAVEDRRREVVLVDSAAVVVQQR